MICQSCGARLSPQPQGGFAACEFCGSSPVPLPPQGRDGELNVDLAEVEQWWNRERQRYLTADRRGNLHPPEEQHVGLIVLMVLGMILGLSSAVAGQSWDWKWGGVAGFFLFPVLITLPAALYHQRAEKRYKEYQKLEAEYQGRRNAINDRHARRNV